MVAARAVRSLLGLGVLVLGVLTAKASLPQRIGTVDDDARVAMSNGVSPKAKIATDLGAAKGDKALTSMSLRFSMTQAQQAALTQLLVDQQNPASPRYHQWLTPEQFGAQFGLSASDLVKVTRWLTSQGFTVTKIARGGTYVSFKGTVAQANKAFQIELHTVELRGETHVANLSSPTLPAAIAAVTRSVMGLNDFTMQARGGSTVNTVRPAFTSSGSGVHYLAPGDLYTIYDENALLSSSINGAGVTVAVVGQVDINLSDVAAFQAASGLTANVPTVQVYGADPGAVVTSSASSQLDFNRASFGVEWAGAMAPGATILYVNSTNVIDGSLTEAIDNNLAPIIADSYGECEANVGPSDLAVYTTLLQMAASEGITVVAPGGNSGATDCDAAGQLNVATAQDGPAVDFPASSPYVTAVGGTEFNEGGGTYFNSTNGANGGSAIAYIPEVVWNDTALVGEIQAGGGGASLFFTKPSWQTGNGVPQDFSRDVPDVALSASPAHDSYLFCQTSFCTGGTFAAGNGGLDTFGGTDATAPVFAGMMALVVQKTGGRVGVANGTIYALANSTFAANVFHDVTSGSNAIACATGSTGCPSGGTIGYMAAVGYDLASGWGSVDVANLVNDWGQVTPLPTTGGAAASLTNLTASASSVPAGTAVSLSATVSSGSGSGSPTGSVQFTVDGVASGQAVALMSGVAMYSLPTTGLSAGVHAVQATYLGDATFLGSKGAFSLNVTLATGADFTLTPATASVSVASGSLTPTSTVFTVTSLNGFTGMVTFSASASSTLAATYSFTVNPVSLTAGAASTTLNLFAYTGNLDKKGGVQTIATRSTKQDWERTSAGVALAGLLLLFAPRRRKLGALLMALVGFGALSTVGCLSSANNAIPLHTPTPAGTYSVTVGATSTINGTAVTHSSTVTFVVQ